MDIKTIKVQSIKSFRSKTDVNMADDSVRVTIDMHKVAWKKLLRVMLETDSLNVDLTKVE